MKKRVIAFLLSISMLVAAVPVTTISSAAAEKLTTITAPDIFKMNSDGKLILAPNIVATPNEKLTILHAAAILVAVLRPTEKVESKNAIGLTDKTRGIYERAVGMGVFSATAKTNVNAKLSVKGAYAVLDRVFKFTEEQKGLANSVSPEILLSGVPVAEFIAAVDSFAGTILNGKGTYKIDEFDTDNVTITKSDITLEGATIENNLTIADGVGDGDVTLIDVKVMGNIVARTRGDNTFFVASVLNGNTTAYYPSLGDAVEAANKIDSKNASDTVLTLLCDVEMAYGITISKPTTINGNGNTLKVLKGIVTDPLYQDETALLISSNNVNVSNLTLEILSTTTERDKFINGITVCGSEVYTGVSLTDNTITAKNTAPGTDEQAYGIYLLSPTATVRGNKIFASYGIGFEGIENGKLPTITGNTVNSTNYAFYLAGADETIATKDFGTLQGGLEKLGTVKDIVKGLAQQIKGGTVIISGETCAEQYTYKADGTILKSEFCSNATTWVEIGTGITSVGTEASLKAALASSARVIKLTADINAAKGFTVNRPVTIDGTKGTNEKWKITVKDGINVSETECALVIKSNDVIIKNIDVSITGDSATGATPNAQVGIFVSDGYTGVQITDDTLKAAVQKVALRPNFPNSSYDYAAKYAKCGAVLSTENLVNTYTVTNTNWTANKQDLWDVRELVGGVNNAYIALTFEKPTNAVSVKMRSNNTDFTNSLSVDLTKNGAGCHDGQFFTYFVFAKAIGEGADSATTVKEVPKGVTWEALEDKTYNLFFEWTLNDGTTVITKAVVVRKNATA